MSEQVAEKDGVLIIGGGIGGCATAHKLIQGGYQGSIRILEKFNQIGGMSRSSYLPGTRIPTEYCWRAEGEGYTTYFKILKQVPFVSVDHDNNNNNNNETCYDQLVRMTPPVVSNSKGTFLFETSLSAILKNYWKAAFDGADHPWIEQYSTINRVLYATTSSQARLDAELRNVSWNEFLKRLSDQPRKYLVGIIAPFIGIDIYSGSAYSVFQLIESRNKEINTGFRVFNAPTSEAFLEPWHLYLEQHGVQFDFNTSATEIVWQNEEHTKIESIKDNRGRVLKADDYVFAVPPLPLADLFAETRYGPVWKNLAEKMKQVMVGIQLYFDTVLVVENLTVHPGIYLPESPWQLVIEPQGQMWGHESFATRDPAGLIKDCWSIGLCDAKKVGVLIKKPWPCCTHSEIATEAWYQIQHSYGLPRVIKIQNKKNWNDLNPVRSHVWDSWKPVNSGCLDSDEPKYSSNAGTWKLRPTVCMPGLDRIFFAGAHVKNGREVLAQDTAAETGFRVGQAILNNGKCTLDDWQPVSHYERSYPILNPLRKVDAALFAIGLPHLSFFFLGQSTLVVLLYAFLVACLVGVCAYGIYSLFRSFSSSRSIRSLK